MHVSHDDISKLMEDKRSHASAPSEKWEPLRALLLILALSAGLWAIILTPVFWLLG